MYDNKPYFDFDEDALRAKFSNTALLLGTNAGAVPIGAI